MNYRYCATKSILFSPAFLVAVYHIKKFLYNVVKPGARAREYEDALQWLVNAEIVYKVFRIKTPGLPISAYDDLSAFKIYLSDVGVLRRLSKLDPSAIAGGNRLFTEFKGALTENFILQSLVRQFEIGWQKAVP